MSSPSPWGHGLRGGGSALPFERGWGGAAGWGGQAESPQFLHSKRGQERPQPPAQRAHWFPGAALSALHGPALGAHHLGTHLTKRETEARTGAVPCPASPNKWLLWDSNSPTWGRYETSGGSPGSSHPAPPLRVFRTQAVQVQVLSLPLLSWVTLHLSFPIWEMGIMSYTPSWAIVCILRRLDSAPNKCQQSLGLLLLAIVKEPHLLTSW